ncbi:MAG: ABC transporter permease [Chloroflexota bacterium]|nr:ABC transporter permease [Chloroflexota bacterium]
MLRYVVKRLLLAIPVLLGVTFVMFLIALITPGDPAVILLGERATPEELATLREQLGLNDPWYQQYFDYVSKAARGDFGTSYRSRTPVFEELMDRFPNTVQLTVAAMAVALLIGIPLGVLSAVKQNTLIDRFAIIFAMLGSSMPVFWIGLVLILIFSLRLNLLPASGKGGIDNLILPATALGVGAAALIARITRSSMLEVLRNDYMRTAHAKGLRERVVVLRHGLGNALIPVVTVVGLQFGALLGGAILTETVFAWPGIGRHIVQAIGQRDYPTVRGGVLLVAMTFVIINVLLDVLYAYLDPRIKYS